MNTTDLNSTTSSPVDNVEANMYYVIPKDTYDKIVYAIQVGVFPPTCIFGLLGNAMTFLVLWRQRPRTATSFLQLSLTTADSFYMIAMMIFSALKILSHHDPVNGGKVYRMLIPTFFSYFYQLPVRVSHLIIATIAIERTLAVFLPMKSRQIWTKKVSVAAILFDILVPSAITFPRLYQYELTHKYDNITAQMMTMSQLTELGENKELFGRLYIATVACCNIIPVFTVFFCNSAIIGGLFRRKRMTVIMFGSKHPTRAKDDYYITKTLLTINMVFFFCVMPSAVFIIKTSLDTQYIHPYYKDNVHSLVSYMCLVLDVINSAVNCIIYVASSSVYRNKFKALVCCSKWQRDESHKRTDSGENNDLALNNRFRKIEENESMKERAVSMPICQPQLKQFSYI